MRKEVLKKIFALILNQSLGCLFGRELKRKEPTSLEGVKTQLDTTQEVLSRIYIKAEEVVLFYNGLDVPTRQILDSRGVIPSKTTVDAKVAIQEMAEYS
ncbi:hypothetical protein Tco_1287220 [Tanacetum coccineum]